MREDVGLSLLPLPGGLVAFSFGDPLYILEYLGFL